MKVTLKVLCICVLLNYCASYDLLVNNTAVDDVARNDTSSDKNGDSAKRSGLNPPVSSSAARNDHLMALLAIRRKALMSNRNRPIDEITTAAQRLNPTYVLPKPGKFNSTRSYSRLEMRSMLRNNTDIGSKRREFRPGTRTTKLPDTKNNETSTRIRNETDDIFEVDESNQGLFVVNPKTLEYVPPNDSVPPNSNEVYGSDSRSRISNLKDQSEEQDYDLASFQYFGQKISTPRSNETRSNFYRHINPPIVRWRTNHTKTSREDDTSDMMDIGVARTSIEQNKIRHLKMTAQNRRLALYNNLYRKSGASRLVPSKGNFTLANDTQSNESIINQSRVSATNSAIRESIRTIPKIELDKNNVQKTNYADNSTTNTTNKPSLFSTTKRSTIDEKINIPQNLSKIDLSRPVFYTDNSKNSWKIYEEIAGTTEATTEFLIIIPSVVSEDIGDSYRSDIMDNKSKTISKEDSVSATIDDTTENVVYSSTALNLQKNVATDAAIAKGSIEIKGNGFNVSNMDPGKGRESDKEKTNITVVYRTTSSSNNNPIATDSKLSEEENISKIAPTSSSSPKIPSTNFETTIHPSSTSSTLRIPANVTESIATNNSNVVLSSTVPTLKPITSTKVNYMEYSSSTTSPPTLSPNTQTENSVTVKSTKHNFVARTRENRTQNVMFLEKKVITETSDIKSTTTYDTILRNNNEVIMEIHRINFATYVLAGLGLVPVILITVYVVVNLLNRAKKIPEDLEHCAKDSTPIANTAVDDDCDLYSVTSEYHFDRSNLRFKSILGEGNFGQVWKAEADDLTGHFGSTRIVAVKAERDEGGPGLRAEAEIMKKLGQHINVVTLLGLCMEQEPHLLIMEYAMRGRLLSLLRACKGPDGIREERDRTPPIANIQLTGFALDIAKGMEYIAARKVVHRDLAARNVLIDHNGVCKICDFGMSLDLGTAKVISLPSGADSKRRRPLRRLKLPESRSGDNTGRNTKQRPAMPIRWMAPESLQMHLYSTETDVWAFGVVLWEIFTLGCTPYPNLSGREVVRLVPSGLRLESPRRCCGTLLNLMSRCWKSDSAQRPTFAEARHDLAALHRAESAAMNAVDDASTTDCFDVSGFSEDYENGVVYFDRRISEFECDI